MPTTGSASFAGGSVGRLAQPPATNSRNAGNYYGTANLTANFASGTITGAVTAIQIYAPADPVTSIGSVNDIMLTGTISGSGFSGTASAGTNAGTAFDIAGASGQMQGGFYGPNAAEAAGSYALTGGANSTTIVGSFGAKQAASDRRLKQDVAALGELPNGLRLYSWRYIGGARRYTGVLAQELLADARFADAVMAGSDGLMRVDYARLGYMPGDFAAMQSDGEAAVAAYRRLH